MIKFKTLNLTIVAAAWVICSLTMFAQAQVPYEIINPDFSLTDDEEVITESGQNLLGWGQWNASSVYDPGAEHEHYATIGPNSGAIWQNTGSVFEADTIYVLTMTVRSSGDAATGDVMFENINGGWNTVAVIEFDATPDWEDYSLVIDTAEFPHVVGDNIGISSHALSGTIHVANVTPVLPVIGIIRQPRSQLVLAGEDAVFELTAEADFPPLIYEWYRSQDRSIDIENDTLVASGVVEGEEMVLPALVIEDVQPADEAFYYCRLIDDTGHELESAVVSLAVARQFAHWTMDEADFVDGYYLDKADMYPDEVFDALADGTPEFIEGAIGQAVVIDPNNGGANAGVVSPTRHSRQLTVSFWLNWGGPNGSYQNFISKRQGAFSSENMVWQISSGDDNDHLWFQSAAGGLISVEGGLVDDGQWQFITVTFDGSTGTIYVNGAEQASGSLTLGQGYDAPLMLGKIIGADDQAYFATGALDDIQIYNYAFTPMEIAQIYFEQSGNRACLEEYRPQLDYTGDCRVGLADFAHFAQQWLYSGILDPSLY